MAASEQRSRNRTKLTRKDLKAPDEFITLTGRFVDLASQHLRTIALILGIIVALVIVMWAGLAYMRGIEHDAFASLAQIETQLRAARDDGPVSPGLVDQLQSITQRRGAGEASDYAWLYLGQVHYRQREYPAAVTAYQQALARADPDKLLWPLAALGVGYALEAAGDLEQAQAAYQRVIDAKSAGFGLDAYLGKGRVAEGSNDLDQAIAAYTAVIEHFPARAEGLGMAEKVEALKARQK
jgi:tetratricopeptide (TPR) repeat protein